MLAPPRVVSNEFNSAQGLNDVYLSVFQPASTQHWPGNLKRYQLNKTSGGSLLIDANGKPVIDSSGFISQDAVSLWSAPLVDGGEARIGGAASQLPDPSSRVVLSNISGNDLQKISPRNLSITADMVGAPVGQRDTTIAWALGQDVYDEDGDGDFNEARLSMGDPLHVQPLTVVYGSDPDAAETVVFTATNDGYLHAVDARYGDEIWSFIPRRLLGRLFELSLGQPATSKQYGLDGKLSLVEIGNRKLLVFGMRRGGRAMFAMDITNRTQPKLAWVIDSNLPDFADLGQTWSAAAPARVATSNGTWDALLIGGGYDGGQDNRTHRTDSHGNAIYMINAATGALIWSAGPATAQGDHDLTLSRMRYSIPTDLQVVDSNGDGLDDRIYFGDMGGQLWRIDLINGNSRGSLGEGGVMASLGAADESSPTAQNTRRFYNRPDVVEIITDDNVFFAINIGSGYRAHPLDTDTIDEFYSVRDFRPRDVIATDEYGSALIKILTRDDIPDITDNLTPTLESSDAGWRMRMVQASGEKVLASSLTIDGILHFNSFAPAGSGGSCRPGGGQNRFYRVSVLDGGVLLNHDRDLIDDPVTPEDRFVLGETGAYPLDLIFVNSAVCAGVGCFDGDSLYSDGDGDGDGGDGSGNGDEFTGPRARPSYWFPGTNP